MTPEQAAAVQGGDRQSAIHPPHGRALETLDLPPLLADVPAAYRVGLVFIVSLPDVRFDIMCRDQRLDRRKRLRVNHIRGPLAQHEVRAEFREVASDGIFIGPRRVTRDDIRQGREQVGEQPHIENRTLLGRNPRRDSLWLDSFCSQSFGRNRTPFPVGDIANLKPRCEPPIKIEAPCALPVVGWVRELLVQDHDSHGARPR